MSSRQEVVVPTPLNSLVGRAEAAGDEQDHDDSLPVTVLLGTPIHNVSLSDVFESIDARIRRRAPGYVVTPNVDFICRYSRDENFRRAYDGSFLRVADGVPLIWSSRWLGTPLREKISGSDLVYSLTAHAAAQGHSIYFFGAAPGVADEAARRLKERYPKLRIAGAYSPPLGFENDSAATDEAIRRVQAANPDICYVALGCPKQEYWMQRTSHLSRVPVSLGLGGSLDFAAGIVKRAPRVFQRAGLEWAWRLLNDPRRLAKRYLVDDSLFFILLWREMWSRMKKRLAKN